MCRSAKKELPPTMKIIKLVEKKRQQYFYTDMTKIEIPESESYYSPPEVFDTDIPCQFCFMVLKKWPENSEFIDPNSQVSNTS